MYATKTPPILLGDKKGEKIPPKNDGVILLYASIDTYYHKCIREYIDCFSGLNLEIHEKRKIFSEIFPKYILGTPPPRCVF